MSVAMLPFWLAQALASVGVAALVWLLASGLHRLLRVSQASRGFWLGAWAVAVLPTPLALGLQWLTPVSLPLPMLADMGELSEAIASATTAAPIALTSLSLGGLMASLYVAGVAWVALRWAIGLRALRRLLRGARPIDGHCSLGPASHAECRRLQRAGLRIVLLDAAVSPFALRWPRPTIALPRALLGRLDDRQLQLVLRHEAAHLARHDPQWALLLRLVGALLWFNPFVAALARRLRLAAELACDAVAIGAEKHMRRAYAEAYLETLRMSASRALPCPLAAFSPQDTGTHKMRIAHIVHGDPRARKRPLLAAGLAMLALSTASGLTLVQAAAPTSPLQPVAFDSPIISGRISSHYGTVRPAINAKKHNGVDLAAARGTPVHAPAAGIVVVASAVYAPAPNYGSVIVLDHGDGWQTLYAHLDHIDVAVGDKIGSGQPIGRLGSTGQATGPHVHVEVHHHGKRVDPASVMAALVAAG